MSIKYKNTMMIAGLLMLFLGAIFMLLENTFYQYIDEDGVLHESYFMPLGFLSVFLGLVLLLVTIVRQLMFRKNNL
ncbi:MAG: DUF3955 domain-containing protein [Candidatus Endonucleobacter sp. (ex Gigantidas childressi)]|nr:DUF3955 domain-containing protein [Candidatus Endonucleobacter sp. (ex Gigantidas childressi)]